MEAHAISRRRDTRCQGPVRGYVSEPSHRELSWLWITSLEQGVMNEICALSFQRSCSQAPDTYEPVSVSKYARRTDIGITSRMGKTILKRNTGAMDGREYQYRY
jgi:hypothetical protein